MSLRQPQLDDRDFQSLVNEARTRIAHTCPAWNEHNVSDPGITLIELFAWMTDMLVYRVNRIPEKAQIALLDLLGVQLAPAETARAQLRFRLSAPATSRVEIEAGSVEVGTTDPPADGPIVFRTVEPIVVPPLRLAALKVVRDGVASDVSVQAGLARLSGSARAGLSSPSRPDDGLYLGFHDPLAALVVGVTIKAAPAQGTGIAPGAPPWQWEVQRDDRTWSAATVISDETGGFNNASGTIELQVPRIETPAAGGGRRLHWLRCRLEQQTEPDGAGYTRAPRLEQVRVAALGALVQAEHAARVAAPGGLPQAERTGRVVTDPQTPAEAKLESGVGTAPEGSANGRRAMSVAGEIIGYSDGSSGQVFRLRRRPALKLGKDDGLDVFEAQAEGWVPWTSRESFADSGPEDRHYCFDPVAGEVSLGPAIRERDGWVQRGKIPPGGAALRMRYRSGGGVNGNVEAGTLTVLRRTVPGIASVTNPAPARGGVDPQSFAEVRRSAPIELRTRSRAVTAGDFEALSLAASRRVARARCVAPGPGQPVLVGILPTTSRPAERIPFAELQPPEDLLAEVAGRLEECRLLGMSVHVTSMALRGVTVVVEVQADVGADRNRVEGLVGEALYRYINPYVGGGSAREGEGWEFGRALGLGEVEALIRRVRGVRDVPLLRLYSTDLETGKPEGHRLDDRLEIGPDELVASAEHLIRVVETKAP